MDLDGVSDLTSPLTSVPSLPSSPRSSVSELSSAPDSPIPPPGWRDFTPPPSQDAGEDMPPVRKRRKIEQRSRTTQHLDLTSEIAQSGYDREQALEELLKALRKRRKIVVVAGAGISVSAGIPDFRSSHGLFKSLRGEHKLKGSGKQLFDASVYKDDSSTSHFHDMVRQLSKMSADAKPTLFHRLIARLASERRLLRLYTQNVDGLETSLPPLATTIPLAHKGPWPQTIQLHGGLEKMMCQKCRQISNFEPRLFDGPVPPQCPQCVEADEARTNVAGKRSHGIGRLRPRIVLYNEHNPDDEAIGAVSAADCRTRPDAVVVVGTSMKIPGVRRLVSQMCKIVRDRREGTTIWINRDGVPTGKDLEDCWDLVVKGDSDDVARLAKFKDWDEPVTPEAEDYTDSDLEKIKTAQGRITVDVPPSPEKRQTAVELIKEHFFTSTMTPPRSNSGDREDKEPSKPANPLITLKLHMKSEQNSISKTASVKNPASAGRKLAEVFNTKENNGAAGKSKTSLNKRKGPVKKATDRSHGQARLGGKVTKAKSSAVLANLPSRKEPLTPKSESDLNTESGNHIVAGYESLEHSPIPTTPSNAEAVSPTLSWKDQPTVSPKGNIPPDLVKLLN